MTGNELRTAYLDFFKAQGHAEIPSAPLVPVDDPTTLFTSSGMQPLVRYLLGETHAQGKRLVDSQKCFRAEDIEEVGDNRHTTFFEMLGNWSFGDYFKAEQLSWFFQFLTEVVGLDPKKLYVTVFSGDPENNIPLDQESVDIWQKLFKDKGIESKLVILGTEAKAAEQGMDDGRIFAYDAKKNWWSRSGVPSAMPAGEPGGPDSEVFYDFGTPHDPKFGKNCHPNCDCGRFMEIGNSVFMQYQKQSDGTLKELEQKNVDFGGGLERILAARGDNPDVFKTDLIWPLVEEIEKVTGKPYAGNEAAMRLITDHLKAAIFMINDGVIPSNKQQGYMLRRLLRRAVYRLYRFGATDSEQIAALCNSIIDIYRNVYFEPNARSITHPIVAEEAEKFLKVLKSGLKRLESTAKDQFTPAFAFQQASSFGLPFEVIQELADSKGVKLTSADYNREFAKHQELSRTSAKGMFKGGLADQSETVTKYHTATHLLHESLRRTLGKHIQQMGSNITGERLRFDFTHPQALTEEEIKQVEAQMNEQIKADLPVSFAEMSLDDAKKAGALAFFGERYADRVKVYSIGSFSKEVCGGPHVSHTAVIGPLEIYKQESVGAGRRRLYARLKAKE